MKALTLAKLVVGGENKGEAGDTGPIGFETEKWTQLWPDTDREQWENKRKKNWG